VDFIKKIVLFAAVKTYTSFVRPNLLTHH